MNLPWEEVVKIARFDRQKTHGIQIEFHEVLPRVLRQLLQQDAFLLPLEPIQEDPFANQRVCVELWDSSQDTDAILVQE